MNDLSLHVLDIVHNSIKAGAKTVRISVSADTKADLIRIGIADDGGGMDSEFLSRVDDPFATTRTTRRVGLGIPLFKAAALGADGTFSITSELQKGTVVTAEFKISHIDRMPLGDMAETVSSLIYDGQTSEIVFEYAVDGKTCTFSTEEIKAALGGDITDPVTVGYLRDMLKDNIAEINGGVKL